MDRDEKECEKAQQEKKEITSAEKIRKRKGEGPSGRRLPHKTTKRKVEEHKETDVRTESFFVNGRQNHTKQQR